jgi:predicted  nucleic acid-binding Zn-ribbon protein
VNADVTALLALQEEDAVIHGLEQRLATLEPRLRELDRQRKAAEDSLAQARAQVEGEGARMRDLETRAAEHRQLRDRNASQLDTVSARTASAAMSQMEQSRRMVADDEGAARQQTQRVADLERVVQVHERALADIVESQAEARAAIAEERRQIEEELRHGRMKREGSAKRVSRTLLGTYDRIRRKKAPNVLVPLRGGSCGACDLNLPLQRRNEMMRTGEIVMCEGCGVLLYATE